MNLPSRRYVPLFMIGLMVLTGLFAGVMAYAQSTKTALQTQIANCFPTQTVGAITPPITVTCMDAIIASMQQYAGVNAQTATSYTVLQSDYGQLVTFTNTATTSATLPQPISSAFYPFNVFLKNIGAGAVNLLPVGSTVNGATTLQLATGQSVWLVSDNANWQVWNAGGISNTFLTSQIFSNGTLGIGGSSSGITTFFNANNTANNNTITIPGFVSDTLVTVAASANLLNKTLNSPTLNAFIENGLGVFNGQFFPNAGPPTISTGTCGGGTNGTLATGSANQGGKLNIGVSPTTSCAVTFSAALTQTPTACVTTPASAPVAAWQISSVYIQTISNTAFVLAGNALSSTVWYYHCY